MSRFQAYPLFTLRWLVYFCCNLHCHVRLSSRLACCTQGGVSTICAILSFHLVKLAALLKFEHVLGRMRDKSVNCSLGCRLSCSKQEHAQGGVVSIHNHLFLYKYTWAAPAAVLTSILFTQLLSKPCRSSFCWHNTFAAWKQAQYGWVESKTQYTRLSGRLACSMMQACTRRGKRPCRLSLPFHACQYTWLLQLQCGD